MFINVHFNNFPKAGYIIWMKFKVRPYIKKMYFMVQPYQVFGNLHP